jgi:hypothetical protein
MSTNINLQDLSIANFDQLLNVEGVQGGCKKKKAYSWSSSRRSYSSRYGKKKGHKRPRRGSCGGICIPNVCC